MANKMRWCVVVVMVMMMVVVRVSGGVRVLFLTPVCTKSHTIFYNGVVNGLADRGNQVTIVTPFQSSQTRPNVREVTVHSIDWNTLAENHFKRGRMSSAQALAKIAHDVCADVLEQKQVQALLKEEFDVAILSIMYSECFLSMVHTLKVPFIWVAPLGLSGPTAISIGSPQFPSFVGSIIMTYKHPLTFFQRAFATLSDIFFDCYFQSSVFPRIEAECRRRGLCPPDMPNVLEMRKNGSGIILNSVQELQNPIRPTLPVEVYSGGVHCRPPQPLPKDLEEWVKGAGEAGYIFFSLGSNVKPSQMLEEHRAVLVRVLGTLPQRVLWKWDQDNMPDLPPNVLLAKWLPQQDILGDPRLRLFITHGGLLSTQEATYHGVPVLGLPVFADQFHNMEQVQMEGWGRYLLWEDLTINTFTHAITHILNDESVRDAARHRSEMMRDRLNEPRDATSFFVEYVARHKGAHHLRCPAISMPWYQLYNVDVWCSVVVVVCAVMYLCVRLLMALCPCLCRRSSTKHKHE